VVDWWWTCGVWTAEAEERREKEQRQRQGGVALLWAARGGLTGAGQEVALSSVCVLFPLPRSASRALVHTGRRVVARVPLGVVTGAENRDLFWAAPCGKRDDDRSKVTAFRVRVRAQGLENDAGLRDLVSHKQAVKLGSIIVVYFVMY
jgi:hypothetical protein